MGGTGRIAERLAAAGHALPPAMPAVASYVPVAATEMTGGILLHVAGQGPFRAGTLEFVGRIGGEIDVAQACESARLVTLNVLAQLSAAMQDVGAVPTRTRCLRLGIFLHCDDGFGDMDIIADAASDLVVVALGTDGRHCRSVAGMPVLPMRTSVEIDGLFFLER